MELAGALIEIAVHSLGKEFDVIDPTRARVLLVEAAIRAPCLSGELFGQCRRQLETLGVEVLTGTMVSEIDEGGVTLSDGGRIESGLVLWAAECSASNLGDMLDVETDRTGRVPVESDMSVPGHREVFVVGDLAIVAGVPGVAPAAMQMGRHAGRMIEADLRTRSRFPFHYRNKGALATIGRARAVADFGQVRFGGFLAWVAWLAIHIFFLIGFRNRVLVLISWAWSYLTFRRGAGSSPGSPTAGEGRAVIPGG